MEKPAVHLTERDLDRPTVSIMRACALTGVSRRTIYNWLATDKLEFVRTPSGAIRIFADGLLRRDSAETRRRRRQIFFNAQRPAAALDR